MVSSEFYIVVWFSICLCYVLFSSSIHWFRWKVSDLIIWSDNLWKTRDSSFQTFCPLEFVEFPLWGRKKKTKMRQVLCHLSCGCSLNELKLYACSKKCSINKDSQRYLFVSTLLIWSTKYSTMSVRLQGHQSVQVGSMRNHCGAHESDNKTTHHKGNYRNY